MLRPIHLAFLAPSLLATCLAAEDIKAPAPVPAPAADNGNGISLSASLLFQSFRNAGEDYVMKETATVDVNDGEVLQGESSFSPGFRLGGSWTPENSSVSYGLDFMYLKSDADDSTSDPNDNMSATQFHPDFSADIGEEDVGRADATVETTLMQVSLLMGTTGKFENGLRYGINAGLTYLDFTNEREYNYFDAPVPTAAEDHVRVEREQEFSGIGVTVCGKVRTHFAYGISAFGGLGLSLITGSSDVSVNETEPDDSTVNVDNDASIDHLVTVIRATIGIGWETSFSDDLLTIDLSYDLESYLGLKRDIKYVDDVNDATTVQVSDDIALDGLRLTIGYQF